MIEHQNVRSMVEECQKILQDLNDMSPDDEYEEDMANAFSKLKEMLDSFK